MADAIRLSFGFRDVKGIVANLHASDVRMQKETRRAVKDAGDFMHDLAFFLAPVDTEWMRDHIKTLFSDDGLVVEVGYRDEDFVGRKGYDGRIIETNYGPLVEDGTRKMAAQPHLRPAFEEGVDFLSRDISAAIRRSLPR